MNKTNYILAILSGILILLAVTIFIAFGRTEQADSHVTEASRVQEYDYEYIVKEYDGKVGVFLPSESIPAEVLDIDISILPEQDQKSLKEGIKVKDKDALNRLIEDFDG